MSIGDLPPSTVAYGKAFDEAINVAAEVKDSGAIEPPLSAASLRLAIQNIEATRDDVGDLDNTQAHAAAVEVVVRERFYGILVSPHRIAITNWSLTFLEAATSIEEPAFGQMWNLLDVVSILSDHGMWRNLHMEMSTLMCCQSSAKLDLCFV